MKAKPPITSLSPAERTAKLLAFKKLHSHNFTTAPTPSKPIHVASTRFATA
jgi:hypothetical protein